MQGWGFDSRWDNPFSKNVSTGCTVMSALHQMAYVKSDNNREKHWWTLCCMKTNGVNIPGKPHWHCVCESSLGSEKLWIHAGSQGAILDQSIWRFGTLHSGSCCLPYTPFLSAQHQSRAQQKQAKIYWDRSSKFGIGTMFDQDIKGLVKYVWWRYTRFPHLQ